MSPCAVCYASWKPRFASCLSSSLFCSRKLAESFRSLPDPITYPDYNRTVREPESIDNVAVS